MSVSVNPIFFFEKLLLAKSCQNDHLIISSLMNAVGTGWPVVHGRVVLLPSKTWLVQCMLLYSRVHFSQGTRTTRPCLTGRDEDQSVAFYFLTKPYRCRSPVLSLGAVAPVFTIMSHCHVRFPVRVYCTNLYYMCTEWSIIHGRALLVLCWK